jgi:hypothetical protein
LNLKSAFAVELEAIPPYNFELALKPASWYWSLKEITREGYLLESTRFKDEL